METEKNTKNGKNSFHHHQNLPFISSLCQTRKRDKVLQSASRKRGCFYYSKQCAQNQQRNRRHNKKTVAGTDCCIDRRNSICVFAFKTAPVVRTGCAVSVCVYFLTMWNKSSRKANTRCRILIHLANLPVCTS